MFDPVFVECLNCVMTDINKKKPCLLILKYRFRFLLCTFMSELFSLIITVINPVDFHHRSKLIIYRFSQG